MKTRKILLALLVTLGMVSSACAEKDIKKKSENAGRLGQEIKRPSDAEMTKAISNELFFDRYFDSKSMTITTKEGVVDLVGEVDTLRSRERAVHLAESIKGVRAVVNRLIIKGIGQSDEEIRLSAIDALLNDPTTDSYKLKVKVNEGTVNLDGTVESAAEKGLAEWVVKGIPGARGIENNIKIRHTKERADVEISQDVKGRIIKDPYLLDSVLNVKVKDRVVILDGTVGSMAAKRRAHSLSWVTGVKGIKAEGIKVEPWMKNDMKRNTSSTVQSDDNIEKALRDAFLYDPRVLSFNPDISVKYGVVTLSGKVDNLAAKHAAEQDAYNTIGVVGVNNLIKVAPLVKRSDKELKQAISSSFSFNLVSGQTKDVKVRVSEGIVTLHGSVNSPYVKDLAASSASRVNGVKEIRNKLEVKGATVAEKDKKIEDRIKSGIFWNPYLDWADDEVNVEVKNGLAKITGNVDSWEEHLAATREAFKAGATKVQNSLRVGEVKTKAIYEYDHFPLFYDVYFFTPI